MSARDAKWVTAGLFCILLALVAKFVIDVPILQWVMMIAGGVQIGIGILLGIRGHDD